MKNVGNRKRTLPHTGHADSSWSEAIICRIRGAALKRQTITPSAARKH